MQSHEIHVMAASETTNSKPRSLMYQLQSMKPITLINARTDRANTTKVDISRTFPVPVQYPQTSE